MDTENVAEVPLEPVENDENPTSQPLVETYVAQVSSITEEKTAETSEQVQSHEEVHASISGAAATVSEDPPAGQSHEEIVSVSQNAEEASGTTTELTEVGSIDTDFDELSSFINQQDEDAEMLTVENLEKIEQKKKNEKKLKKDKELKKRKQTLKIGSLIAIVPSDSDGESPISSDEDSESDISIVSFKMNFLNTMGSLPRLSQISLDRVEESIVVSTRDNSVQPEVIDPDLKGKFVNSLTGETESTSSEEVGVEGSFETMELEVESAFSDFDLPSDTEDVPSFAEKKEEVSFFFEEPEVIAESGRTTFRFETESFIKARELRTRATTITMDFLYHLFDRVVHMANAKTLSDKLDKIKLFNELEAASIDYRVEKSCNLFLNSKVVECFRRLRRLWAFTKLSNSEELFEYGRYKRALNNLDHLKERSAAVKKKCYDLTTNVMLEITEVNAICTSLTDRIEQRIREVLIHKDSEMILKAIQVDMQTMRRLQNEISESRTMLFNRKHTLAKLIERTLDFEKITDDLTTSEFLSVQREVMQMSKRLNERDERLQVVHERCNKELKRAVYYYERRNFELAVLASKKKILADLCEQKEKVRKHLCKLRMEHLHNISQKHELTLKAGILYKPALMMDYDNTVELVKEKRRNVLKLRNTVENLEKRISVISTTSSQYPSISNPIRKLWVN